MAATNDLAEQLTRALTAEKPPTMADRLRRDDQVWLALNPGSSTNIGGEKKDPGDAFLVDEHQADRLTTPGPRRAMATCRYLDEPEPDTRGDFRQPHGAGMIHPDSKKHKQAKESPLRAGAGQQLVDGELVEAGVPSDKDRGAVETTQRPDHPSIGYGGGQGPLSQQAAPDLSVTGTPAPPLTPEQQAQADAEAKGRQGSSSGGSSSSSSSSSSSGRGGSNRSGSGSGSQGGKKQGGGGSSSSSSGGSSSSSTSSSGGSSSSSSGGSSGTGDGGGGAGVGDGGKNSS